MTRYEIENKRIILRIKRGFDLRQTLMELAKREVRFKIEQPYYIAPNPIFKLYSNSLCLLLVAYHVSTIKRYPRFFSQGACHVF